MKTKILLFILILAGCLAVANLAQASVYITPASNGEAIPISSVNGEWTSLSPIIIQEGMPGDIRTGDIILRLPDGFEFNADSAPNVVVSGSTELRAHFTSISANEIKITVNQISVSICHSITIGNTNPILVRPTDSNLPSGYIYMVSSTVQGVSSGPEGTSFGVLTTIPVELEPEPEPEPEPEESAETESEDEVLLEELRNQILELRIRIIDILQRIIQLLTTRA